ncbi:MAG: hypothetical protein QW275_03275, partial [Candidatus Anstonellaceae archaeon]
DAPVPQSGNINAASENPAISLSCANPILVVRSIGPDYVVSHIAPSNLITPINGRVSISVRVSNIGNVNVTVPSTTTLFGGNCTASGQDQTAQTPPLAAGQTSPTMAFSCTCNSPGLKRVVAEANFPRNANIQETDYANNQGFTLFYCGNPFAPVCADYV